MESRSPQGSSWYEPLIERFADIKAKYGDEYPIIFYEPNSELQEKKASRNLIQGNRSIHLYSELEEAYKFAQALGISFILIASSDCDEWKLTQTFQNLNETYKRRMFDFEEEALFKDLFRGISDVDDIHKPLKAYVFFTLLEFMNGSTVDENEKEVMVMCDVKDMAKNFREEFIIIWYDSDISVKKKRNFEEKLEINLEEENIYTDFAKLYKRIKNYAGTPYHLILSRRDKAEKIIKEIEDFKDLLGLYIYFNNQQKIEEIENDKVKIQPTFEELVPKIKEGIRERSRLINTFPVFATNFDAWDKSSTYSNHYYLKALINFHNRMQAREDFIKLARTIYQDHNKLLNRFENEYNRYDHPKILYWYSKDSPVYRLINNCLRISSSDSILFCRFVLKDLERAIRERYQQSFKDFNGIVYRAAYLSKIEFEKLQRNTGKEIEIYGFLSTSVSSRAASRFLNDPQNQIWVTIIIPPLPELDEQGFADISQFSDFKSEKEILFNVRSKFRILETGVRKITKDTECRYLNLIYAPQLLRRHMTNCQPSLKVELQLPLEMKCEICCAKSRLFGFKQNKTTHVSCIDCLIKNSIPKDILLLALDKGNDVQENRNIVKIVGGKRLKFTDKVSFQISGYQCRDCKKTGKGKYYKWISLEGQKGFNQCSECFEKKKEIVSEILVSEENPYGIWQEHEKEWEMIDSSYRGEFFEKVRLEAQDDVYFEVQKFDLCIKYEKSVLNKLVRRRRKEIEKLQAYEKLGRSFQKLGQYQEALKYYHKVLYIVKTAYGENHADVATAYNNLGSVYKNLEEHKKTLEYFSKALDLIKVVYGEEHAHTANTYNNISSVFQSLGEYQQAQDFCQKALEVRKTISGENHPETAALYNNLAVILEKFGKNQQALEESQKALGIWKSIYGEKHPDTAISYNTLGSIYENMGENQEALEHYQKGLGIRIDIYGKNHPDTALAYHNCASVYEGLKEYQKALDYYQKAHDIWRATYGEKHPDVALSFCSLASVFESLKQPQKAIESFKKALNIRKMISLENHPDNATVLASVARIYKSLEDYQEALEYYIKALDAWKSTHKEPEPNIVTLYHCLGSVYQSLGQYQQARECFGKALDICKVIYGENHADTARSFAGLGEVSLSLEDHSSAIEYCRESLHIQKAIFGEKHPDLAVSYNDLASAYMGLSKFQKAREYFIEALNLRKAIYGENHQCTAASYSNLAVVYQKLEKYKQALDCCQKSLDIRKAIRGENHSETALSYDNLASIYELLGERESQKTSADHNKTFEYLNKALENYHKALKILKDIYEENHPSLAACYRGLGGTYESLGNYPEALAYHMKALDIMRVICGENHPDLALSYSSIASISQDVRLYDKALEYYTKASNIWKSVYGEKNSFVATSYNNLAMAYLSLDHNNQALEYCKNALNIRKAIYGEMHPETVLSYNNLASIYGKLGEHRKAQECALKAQYFERILYGQNPSVGY